MKLYLDLDGVLADFDKRVSTILGVENSYKFEFVHGADEYWRRINEAEKRVFETFELMPDAMDLWWEVAHLNPVILTALPKSRSASVDRQKRKWVREQFGSHVKVVTCFTKDKPNYCATGDVLVDDRSINRAAWHAKGGTLVLHTSAAETITTLKGIGVL